MDNYDRIARAIRYLDAHRVEQPDLASVAAQAQLSPAHFHRLFTAWAGVTPKDFLQCLTAEHAKRALRRGASVLDAALDAGLSSPGRLHDLCVSLEAATPGELKAPGAGWTLRYGHAGTPFGVCLVAEGPRGVCHVSFVESMSDPDARAALAAEWPHASLQRDEPRAAQLAAAMFRAPDPAGAALRAYVKGSAFQVRVWRALLEVPRGALVSYAQLAAAVGAPRAARAVGSAVAQNTLAYLIPCHRVIRQTGIVGDYRWGSARKRALIAWEVSTAQPRAAVGDTLTA
jgi:AraC family transcriptional regulator of adaptative response/methylated-DNA-[protein]-cysteine methyltransferase